MTSYCKELTLPGDESELPAGMKSRTALLFRNLLLPPGLSPMTAGQARNLKGPLPGEPSNLSTDDIL